MIPLRDTIESRNYPIVNTLLIGVNILCFLIQIIQGSDEPLFILTYGLVPARYSVPEIAAHFTSGQQVVALFSFMFLHGDFWHILGNMWSLYIFGDNIEDRLGHLRYIFFYLLCGWTSGLVHLFMNWHSPMPTIGASGAIAGVMGAYLLLYPRSRILTLIPIFFIPYFIELPAFIFLGIWFIFQFLSVAGSHGQSGGIAWWAHIGGFLAGMAFLKLLLKLPELGMTNRIRSTTGKNKTHRLQVIRPVSTAGNPNLYGNITIAPREARHGTRKLINVPWGFKKRILRVVVPPGIENGTILRLSGMGKEAESGGRGDLLLKVLVST